MENSNSNNAEVRMDHYSLIESLFNDFLSSGGAPKVTEFKRHVDKLIKDKIKPLCSGRGASSPGGSSWRDVQKSLFAGRGAKWQEVPVEEVSLTLDRLDTEGFDTSDYRSWTEAAGKAWIRYAGPRVVTGKQMAAFEVRTTGSTYDCPKQLHYIANDELESKIKSLAGTPHSLKLEVIATKDEVDPSDETVSDETEVKVQPVVNDTETSQAPTSSDPAEWEAFLEGEGLGANQFDEENEGDLFDEV